MPLRRDTHTQNLYNFFFTSAGDGTRQQVLFLTTYNRSLLVSQHVILARRIRFRRTHGGSDFPLQHHSHGDCAMERKAMEKKHTRKDFESSCPIPIIIIGTCCCCCCGEGFYHEKRRDEEGGAMKSPFFFFLFFSFFPLGFQVALE